MKTTSLHRSPVRGAIRSQQGVVLLFSLIALVILLIAAVALVRSFHSSLFSAGNIAFKRDMQNQSERAVATVLRAFGTGALNTSATRKASLTGSNYSATMLAVTAQGIPTALQNDTTFGAVGLVANDIINQGVTVRYVVDRLCEVPGDESVGTVADSCMLADNPVQAGTSSSNLQGPERSLGGTGKPSVSRGVLYRLSIKVTGPRNTQSFFQSTFTVPS